MAFGQRMKEARIAAGLTQRELADRMGFKHNAVSNWEHGKNIPDAAVIELLCLHLRTSPNRLIWGDNAPSSPIELSPEERRLLTHWRKLGTASRAAVGALMDHFLQAEAAPSPAPALRPAVEVDFLTGRISTQSVAAGLGTYLGEDSFEEIRVARNRLTARASFFVPVAGDSMEPKYQDGDILIVEQSPAARGETGVFTIRGLGYVKVRGERELLSLNPAYSPIPMDDSIRCNGRVIGVLEEDWILE